MLVHYKPSKNNTFYDALYQRSDYDPRHDMSLHPERADDVSYIWLCFIELRLNAMILTHKLIFRSLI